MRKNVQKKPGWDPIAKRNDLKCKVTGFFFAGDQTEAKAFSDALQKSSNGMGFLMGKPKENYIKDNRTAAFVDAVQKAADLSPQV